MDIKHLDFEKMTTEEIAVVRNALDPDSLGFGDDEVEGGYDED